MILWMQGMQLPLGECSLMLLGEDQDAWIPGLCHVGSFPDYLVPEAGSWLPSWFSEENPQRESFVPLGAY